MKHLLFLLLLVLAIDANAQVFIENFRNVNCGNCRPADDALEAFLKANPQLNVHLIYYHDQITLPKDTFYVASKEDVNARYNFYGGALPNPYAFINGYDAKSSFSTWKQYIEEAPPLTSSITGTVSTSGKVIEVKLTASGSSSGKTVIPYVMVLESDLYYDNPYSYGKTEGNLWHNIFRATIPSKSGGEEFVLSGSKEFNYTYDATAKNWDFSKLKVITFLQEKDALPSSISHPVIAVATIPVESASVKPSSILSSAEFGDLTPNPFSRNINIPFTLREPSRVTISISDLLGREVATVIDERITEKQSSISFKPQYLSEGLYVMNLYVNGLLQDSRKLIYNPR